LFNHKGFSQEEVVQYIVELGGTATTGDIVKYVAKRYNLHPNYDLKTTLSRRLNAARSWGNVDKKLSSTVKLGGREYIWFTK